MAAVVLGMHVAIVSIEAKGWPPSWRLRGGVIASFDSARALSRHDAEKAATAGLAGEQAERLWCRLKTWRRQKSSQHASFSGDHAYVQEMLGPCISDSADKKRTIKRLKIAARALLSRNWTCVEVLAKALAERKVLSGREVRRLIASRRV